MVNTASPIAAAVSEVVGCWAMRETTGPSVRNEAWQFGDEVGLWGTASCQVFL